MSIQNISKMLNFYEMAAFINQEVDRMEYLLDKSYLAEWRNVRGVLLVKKDLERGSIKVLQADKSGKFAIIPSTVFERKLSDALNFPFVEWRGYIGQMNKNCYHGFRGRRDRRTGKACYEPSRNDDKCKVFFLNYHKVDNPFRVAVNDNGT